MKSEINKFSKRFALLLVAVLIIITACEDEKEFAQDYDINWPKPAITSLSSSDVMIEDIVTVTGTGLENVTSIRLSGQLCEIVEGSAKPNEIKFKIARRARTGKLEIQNVYRRVAISEESIKVNYPEVKVTEWPEKLLVGKPFSIVGENVDLITHVIVKDSTVEIRNPGSTERISVPTNKFNLKVGEVVSIKVLALGPIQVNEVSGIPVEEEVGMPDAKNVIVLWDFEESDPVITSADVAPTAAARNLGGLVAPRGEKYFSVTKTATTNWQNFIYIEREGSIDLSEFFDPHITFLVNTNGKKGYINPFLTQNGTEADNHLNNGTANDKMKYNDDYMIQTNGWEWRSYPISKLFSSFNATGTFDKVRMRFTSGNVGNSGAEDFEIHVDQIMITDALQLPIAKIADFEDGSFNWEDNSKGATKGINLGSGIPKGAGTNYFTAKQNAGGTWEWQGAINSTTGFDLSTLSDPHISFLVNTGTAKGYLQLETTQNGTKWGWGSGTGHDTAGKWIHVTYRLKDVLTANWNGGAAASFDPAAAVDYLKIGFTTGEVGVPYELNVDNIYLSDGPMW